MIYPCCLCFQVKKLRFSINIRLSSYGFYISKVIRQIQTNLRAVKWCYNRTKRGGPVTEKCEFHESCGFLRNLGKNAEVTRQAWIRSFCGNKERARSCQRKEYRKQTGDFPPDNIAPTGKILRRINQRRQSDSGSTTLCIWPAVAAAAGFFRCCIA